MENPSHFAAYLIDPYREAIELVETTDSLAAIARLIGTARIGFFCPQSNEDVAVAAAETLPTHPRDEDYSRAPGEALWQRRLIPRGPAWQWLPTMDVYYGRALWVKLHDQTRLQTPSASKSWLLGQIDFWGFANVVQIRDAVGGRGSVETGGLTSDEEGYFEDYMLDSADDSED